MPDELIPIEVLEGVEPSTDSTPSSTPHWVFSKRIRFVNGYPEKIGGWQSLTTDDNDTILGSARSIFSYKLNGFTYYLIGTNEKLYVLFGTALTNITPVKTTTIAIADSLDTYYATLGSNPIATVDGSTTVTITDNAHKFRAGDTVTISGVPGAVNGIPAANLNGDQFIRTVSTNSYTIIVNTAATSTGSGGGASVVRASGIITVNATAHGLTENDRVKLASAADTGGILAADINAEFPIFNVTANTFDVFTEGTATSSVTGGGGASTTYQEPINFGPADTILGQGYGLGLYGVGLYGVSKVSSNTIPPRIWSHDRFGDLTVSTPGDQGAIYSWNSSTTAAPAPVTNAPPANYVFVSNNIVVALGYDSANTTEQENGISWSDQGGITNWTTGQAGSDVIEGAGKFLSHASTRGENLLFTENQVYIFRYIGGQFIWQTQLLEPGVGIIAQNARVGVTGAVYWMANNNFYMWRGGNVEVIPSNSDTKSTCLKYVFDDINFGQKEKIFCWYNSEFREVWWHYPSSNSNEPDRVVRVNVDTFSWAIDEHNRTAAEYPAVLSQTPYLIGTDNVIYLHENGLNDDGSGMDWSLKSNLIFGGTDTIQHAAFIPDQTMTGSMNVNLKTRNYPSSSNIISNDYTVTSTTDRVSTTVNGRFFQYTLSGNDLNQTLEFGRWFQEVKRSSPK